MRVPSANLVALVPLVSLLTSTADAWSPANLLRLGRGQRRLVKRPFVPTTLQVLAESAPASSLSSTPSSRFNDNTKHIKSHVFPPEENVLSEAPSLKDDSDIAAFQDEPLEKGLANLKVPQIHLPPRLAPNVGWKHHHRATTRLVHDRFNRQRKSEDDEDNDTDIEEKQKLLVSATPEWKRLQEQKIKMDKTHLRELLKDSKRSDAMFAEHDGVYLDYSRQLADRRTLKLLQDLAVRQKLEDKIQAMVSGEKINFTEDRAVLHTALRADRSETVLVDGENVIEEVHQVLDQIKHFTEGVRSGSIRGYTGKRLRNIISVGIGGSYLGPEFLHEVLKTEPEGISSALGYSLRFLANVDPVDVERTCADLDPEETLIVVVSKTFTTAETMLNARTMRQWLWDFMGNDKDVVMKHMVACASTSAADKVQEFGMDTDNYFFRFWDWVGGRYSVCSAAGAVPISLLYGFDLFEKFLKVRTFCSVKSFSILLI
jgi:hypothetical protein